MEIRYKQLIHERSEDAPFVGCLITAIDCKFGCKGCFNEHIKLMTTQKREAKDIIAEVKANPFNEGIILGGLEWSLQPEELVELCHEASSQGLKIMIYTGCANPQNFNYRIGKACCGKVGMDEFQDPVFVKENDRAVFSFIGGVVMDYACPDDYYLKTGKYLRHEKDPDNRPFGVQLASANQKIYLIKKVEDEE